MYKLLDIECSDRLPFKAYCPSDLAISEGDNCIVNVDDIQEFGKVTKLVVNEGPETEPQKKIPKVMRRATYQDLSMAGENQLFSKSAWRKCQEKVDKLELDMQLVSVRYSFDRQKLLVFFTAEERVDFRQLVHDLSEETQARVEMRQLGVRDAAQMIGGLSSCGRVLCCKQWLTDFDNVYIRMAKNQGLSLNPVNINGMCGRLKCCLRYEDNCYVELGRSMPREGNTVDTPDGTGKVIARNILGRRLRVCLEDNRIMDYDVSDVRLRRRSRKKDVKSAEKAKKNTGSERTESEPAGNA